MYAYNKHHRLHSQPEFQKLNHSYGNDQYLVSLESTGLTPGNFSTIFLFQITDTDSRNVSYVWQVNLQMNFNEICKMNNITYPSFVA